MSPEMRKSFHHHLEEVGTELVKLGAMVTETLPRATEVLLEGDLEAAEEIVQGDDAVNELALEVEESCFELLALQQPMASDLRAIVTAIRMCGEIERSGDLVVNIVKAARRIYGVPLDPRLRGLITKMSAEAVALFRHAIDAYAEHDAALAAALDDIDDRLDELHAHFIEAIFECFSGGEVDLQVAVQLAMVARFYERIGDHAVNIGERVEYMVTGWLPEHEAGARKAARQRVEGRATATSPAAPAGDTGAPGG